MFSLEKITNKFIKGQNKNEINFKEELPLDSLLVNNDKELKLITCIGDINYNRRLVVTDLKGNILHELLNKHMDCHLAKDKESLYVAGDNNNAGGIAKVYKYSLKDFSLQKIHEFEVMEIDEIVVNDSFIYIYDIKSGFIFTYDKNFKYIESNDIKKHNGSQTSWGTKVMTGAFGGYTSFDSKPWKTEQDYYNFQCFLVKTFGKKPYTKGFNTIKGIAHDDIKNRLYIAFYDFICVIENNLCDSFLYFPKKGITSIKYDNDINSLMVCYSNLKYDSTDGSIRILQDEEIDNIKKKITPFRMFKEEINMDKRKRLTIGNDK